MRIVRRRKAMVWFAAVGLGLGLEGCSKKTVSPTSAVPAASGQPRGAPASTKPGLTFRLSEAQLSADKGERNKVADAKSLDSASTNRLLSRLAAMTTGQGETKTFAFRERSLPPPRTGATVQTPFPPPEEMLPPKPSPAGELKVLRGAPEGDVELSPNLSVTFSQPMVPVTSHADSIAEGVPVKITPTPKGKWRWIGTQTLLFEPEKRFPKSTDYEVEVPAGIASTIGGKLAEPKKWRFSTPPLRLQGRWPSGGPFKRDVLVFASFDQAIDAEAVAAKISLMGAGKAVAMRPATTGEIDADETVKNMLKSTIAGRYVALKPTALLDANTSYMVSVAAGAPSKEGPKTTKDAQTFSFSTYAPLQVSWTSCPEDRKCPPPAALHINFNNPLDEDAFDRKHISVEPAIDGMKVEARGSSLTVFGKTKGRTTYAVTLPPELKDMFGQTLGKSDTRKFYLGSARPRLFSTMGSFNVLDPSGDKSVSVYSINQREIEVLVHSVDSSDWKKYIEWQYRGLRKEDPESPPGSLRMRKVISPKGEKDEMVETKIDLREALDDGYGQRVVLVRQKPLPEKVWERQYVAAWIQATDIGVQAFIDDQELLAWVTKLVDGKPIASADVRIFPDGDSGATGADGLASLSLPTGGGKEGRIVVAKSGADSVILPESHYGWQRSSSWYKQAPGSRVQWFVFDDRKLYKPKEEVRIKGWVRQIDFSRTGGTMGSPPGATGVSYQVRDPRGNDLGKGQATLSGLGGFDFAFSLPDNANLGTASVNITLTGHYGSYWHNFQIQEFRRPEFEVSSKVNEGPFFVGGHAEVSAAATYYAGGGLPNADVTWRVVATPGHFVPAKRWEYTFGGAEIRGGFSGYFGGYRHGRGHRPYYGGGDSGSQTETLKGQTDGTGAHRVHISFDSVTPPRPTSVLAQATIIDVNRQSWSTSSSLIVHPSAHYVGLKTDRYFYELGKPIVVKAIVTDLDGKALAGRSIRARAVRLEWRYQKGEYKEIAADRQNCDVKSTSAEVECKFETKQGGQYRITAEIEDDQKRVNRTVMRRWVSGGKMPSKRRVEVEKVELIADKKEYQPGDVAEILIVSPIAPAEALVTVRRSGILRKERISMATSSAVFRVPIEDVHIPGLTVQADIVGGAARVNDEGKVVAGAQPRPAIATGSIGLSVPATKRKLTVDVKPAQEKTEPGAETNISVHVKDANGRGVADSEIAMVVVDESVLALTGYKISGVLGAFYPHRGAGVRDHRMHTYVFLEDPASLMKQGAQGAKGDDEREEGSRSKNGRGRKMKAMAQRVASAPGMTGGAPPPPASPAAAAEAPKREALADRAGADKQPAKPITMRTDFRPLALFAAALKTDAQGVAQVPFKLPDSLTRYRIMALAVAGENFFGEGDASLTARLPLMVRPSAPRFLNFGDKFELPVVVQNQTDEPMTVDVAVRGSNLAFTAGAGRRLTVPANDRIEVRFPAAAVEPGKAGFQIGASAGKWSDASEGSMPVWTPATTEAFATYGTVDKGAIVQPVKFPRNVIAEFGGLEVTTSSTELQALTDAVIYLVNYPFECSEQMASRVVAIAALKDVLAAFNAPGLPPPNEIIAAVRRDLKRLESIQNSDGGFPFWARGYRSWPYLSLHVTHALVRAKKKGFEVPDGMFNRALAHVKNIERYIPSDYPESVRRALRAYSVYVRGAHGDNDVAKAKTLYREYAVEKEPPLEAIGWLYLVLSRGQATEEITEIRRLLKNRVTETAAAAHFATTYGEGNYLLLYSDRRVDAVVLEAMIEDEPKSDLIVKIVRGLLGHRKKGRWGSTQENAWVLLALDKYFHAYEGVAPNFIARAWLGDRFAGQHAFKGRTTERHLIEIPMKYLARAKEADLVVGKQGDGRMYYRIGMKYAPSDLRPPPAEHGFTVTRRYESVDDPKDVRRAKDGTWRVKAGARVKTIVTMVAPTRRYHVALVDPMPAGFEAVNTTLRGAELLPSGKPAHGTGQTGGPFGIGGPGGRGHWYRWWNPTWFEHQNLRDERAEAFSSLVWAGVHTYEYVSRATTPGEFVVPPAKAEEMYHPETFGRGWGDKVVVE